MVPQVPSRVPVMVNVTIPGEPIRKQDCQTFNRTTPTYKTEYRTITENVTQQECKTGKKDTCVNFTLPSFEKVRMVMRLST